MTELLAPGHPGHLELARRTRRWGWAHYVTYRLTAERPFLLTFLLTALGNPVLYLGAMGLGLGALIGEPVGGVDYLVFVAPGLLVSTVVTMAANWGTWPIMSGFKWEKFYFAASATALTPGQIAAGEAAGVVVRSGSQALAFWLIALPFGAWLAGTAWLAVPITVLAALASFTPLMAWAATLTDEGLQFNLLNRFVVMPMFLFAGTFFPLESMPLYLQWIGWISPIWHGTQLARIATYGLANPPLLTVVHVAFLVALAVGGLLVARRTYAGRLVS